MIRFPAMTPARRARIVGVLVVVPAAVFACGFFVVSSLAAARQPASVITLRPARPHPVTNPWHPYCIPSYAAGRAWLPGPVTRPCPTIVPVTPHFTVGGDLATPLYPGTSQRLDLTFTNPGSWPITIPGGGISARNITITSRAPGCASSNFAVTQGLARAVTIPARQLALVSLSVLGVPQDDWPVIEMIETNANQDACRGAKLTLTYSGIEAG